MLKTVPSILAQIVEQKKLELATREEGIEQRAERSVSGRRSFLGALTTGQPAIIAEIKQASPSKGILSGISSPPASRKHTRKAARRRCLS